MGTGVWGLATSQATRAHDANVVFVPELVINMINLNRMTSHHLPSLMLPIRVLWYK